MSDPTTTKTCLPSKAVAETAQSKAAVQSKATTEATPLLEVRHLTKHYPGFTLDDITFAIAPGRITGFIGRNGAGKSTTLKCVEGAVHPDSGTIAYFGRPFAGNEHFAKQRTGFELGGADFYRTRRMATIADVTRQFYDHWDEAVFARYCQLFQLDGRKRIMDLSQGMRVKLTVALALSHHAQLLILDEPTSGLDPASREEVLDILMDAARHENAGVLFSTHITSDLDKCADDILYLRDGKLVGSGPLATFKARYAVAPLPEARKTDAPVLGLRRTAAGDSALVPSDAGIGRPATLEDIMTHLPKEDVA